MEYLYRIVQDALERGQKMKDRVIEAIRGSGLEDTEDRIRKVIFWNRKEKREHTAEEIRKIENIAGVAGSSLSCYADLQ